METMSKPSSCELAQSQMREGAGSLNRPYKRRRIFVHAIQYRFLLVTLSYFSIILVMLSIPSFAPLMQALDDPSLSFQERAKVAESFLGLHERFWPWALGAFMVLIMYSVHSIFLMHRVAGPLHRIQQTFRRVGSGELSENTTLREGDYLHQEAQALNRMLSQLQTRVRGLKSRHLRVRNGYDLLKTKLPLGPDPHVTDVVKTLDAELAHFKTELDEFKTGDR